MEAYFRVALKLNEGCSGRFGQTGSDYIKVPEVDDNIGDRFETVELDKGS